MYVPKCVQSSLAPVAVKEYRPEHCLDGFADLQQADADGVEDQAIGQVAALRVGADRINRSLDIGQPPSVRWLTGAPSLCW